MNKTITVPLGTSDHGDPRLLCVPTKWTDIAVFFLGNYVSHVATVRFLPGEPAIPAFIRLLTALLFPNSGLLRGLDVIKQRAIFGRTSIESAARAGALCTVVRRRESRSLIPQPVFLPSEHAFSFSGRKVHGICCLPEGYGLAILDPNVVVTGISGIEMPMRPHGDLPWWRRIWANILHPTPTPDAGVIVSNEISSSYSFVRGMFAVLQTLFASATLYRTRGDQLQRYGYAAFGLTVTPYLVMSVVNLIGTILTPDYPMVYLVESEAMSEALHRDGARFEGMVGRIREENLAGEADSIGSSTFRALPDNGKMFLDFLVGYGLGSISLAIIGGISGFRAGQSTKPERVWTMMWLVFGITVGTVVQNPQFFSFSRAASLPVIIIYCAPAIGGFVVVGKMLQSYGSCIRIY